jgi:hypothetical protein
MTKELPCYINWSVIGLVRIAWRDFFGMVGANAEVFCAG